MLSLNFFKNDVLMIFSSLEVAIAPCPCDLAKTTIEMAENNFSTLSYGQYCGFAIPLKRSAPPTRIMRDS